MVTGDLIHVVMSDSTCIPMARILRQHFQTSVKQLGQFNWNENLFKWSRSSDQEPIIDHIIDIICSLN